MSRIIHAITATLNLGDDAHVHITLLCQFFLGEFFSQRAVRTASLVAFATYLVFFAMSASSLAPVPFDAEVVAATTADAEFLVAAIDASVGLAAAAAAASLYDDAVDVGLVLLIVTGVQS